MRVCCSSFRTYAFENVYIGCAGNFHGLTELCFNMPNTLSTVQTYLQDSVISSRFGSEGDGKLVNFLNDELVIVQDYSLTRFSSLLNYKNVEVVDSLNVVAGADFGNVLGIQEPSQVNSGIVRVDKNDLNNDYIDENGIVRLDTRMEMALHYCILCDAKFKKYKQAISHYIDIHLITAKLTCDSCDQIFTDMYLCNNNKYEQHG